MSEKKIVFLRSNPVDPDPRVEKEINSLLKLGYKVIILAWDREHNYKIKEAYLNLNNGNVKIYRFGIKSTYGGGVKNNLLPLLLFQMRLVEFLYKFRKKYDIIHACDFDTAYVSFKMSKFLNKKFIYDIFDYYIDAFSVPERLKNIIRKMDYNIINKADGVIICTEKRCKQIEGSNPKNLKIIHNSPHLGSINNLSTLNNLKLRADKVKIVYVGILSEGRMLRELANVVINNLNLELHIAGFGLLEDYFKKLSEKQENIIFYGKINYASTIELENKCDIMTAIYDPSIPNHIYSAPNKFYESLMLGKPILMVKDTGMDEVICKENIGQIIEYNAKSLEQGINNLIMIKSEWEKISIKMKKIYKERYDWLKMEKELFDLYERIEY